MLIGDVGRGPVLRRPPASSPREQLEDSVEGCSAGGTWQARDVNAGADPRCRS